MSDRFADLLNKQNFLFVAKAKDPEHLHQGSSTSFGSQDPSALTALKELAANAAQLAAATFQVPQKGGIGI